MGHSKKNIFFTLFCIFVRIDLYLQDKSNKRWSFWCSVKQPHNYPPELGYVWNLSYIIKSYLISLFRLRKKTYFVLLDITMAKKYLQWHDRNLKKFNSLTYYRKYHCCRYKHLSSHRQAWIVLGEALLECSERFKLSEYQNIIPIMLFSNFTVWSISAQSEKRYLEVRHSRRIVWN
jgi:hypothetical protein